MTDFFDHAARQIRDIAHRLQGDSRAQYQAVVDFLRNLNYPPDPNPIAGKVHLRDAMRKIKWWYSDEARVAIKLAFMDTLAMDLEGRPYDEYAYWNGGPRTHYDQNGGLLHHPEPPMPDEDYHTAPGPDQTPINSLLDSVQNLARAIGSLESRVKSRH